MLNCVYILEYYIILLFCPYYYYKGDDAIEMSTNTAYGKAHQLTSTDECLYEDL